MVQLPTNSNSALGNRNWGLGPSFVVLHLDKGDPWVYGVLANNIWSLSDSGTGGSYNNGLIQPFVNYNFDGGFYITSAPDHHRQLEGREQPAVDRPARRRRRQDIPSRRAAGEYADLGLLQRGHA